MNVQKALGRCRLRHPRVVEYPEGEMPGGECGAAVGKDGQTCSEALIEWAVKLPTKERKT